MKHLSILIISIMTFSLYAQGPLCELIREKHNTGQKLTKDEIEYFETNCEKLIYPNGTTEKIKLDDAVAESIDPIEGHGTFHMTWGFFNLAVSSVLIGILIANNDPWTPAHTISTIGISVDVLHAISEINTGIRLYRYKKNITD